jgi:hypothetical protein
MRLLCAILCLVAGLSSAAPTGSPLIFSDLNNTSHHPLDPGDKLASVLIFFWQDCPISNAYVPEINRLAAGHTNFAFYIVQVDPDLSLAAAKEHAQKFDLHPPVLLDPQHRLVKRTKATVTPEAVVMGEHGNILYRGRIDNRYAALGTKRLVATEHDLRSALDDITAGRPVKIKKTTAIGCSIQ